MVKAGFERGVLSGKDLEDTLLWYFHWLFGGGPGLALAHWHLLTTWIMADLAQNDQHSGWARIDGFACERGRQDKITCIPAADYLEILPGFVSIMCKIDVRRGFIAARKAVPKRLRRVFFLSRKITNLRSDRLLKRGTLMACKQNHLWCIRIAWQSLLIAQFSLQTLLVPGWVDRRWRW